MANEEPFLARWSNRKLSDEPDPVNVETSTSIDDADAFDIDEYQETESATPEDEKPQSLASLLVSQAAKETKKAALRKLFFGGEFSEVDRLNDYDHDYRSVKPLATEVAQQLRNWIHDSTDDEASEESEIAVIDHESGKDESVIQSVDIDAHSETNQRETNQSEKKQSETKNTT